MARHPTEYDLISLLSDRPMAAAPYQPTFAWLMFQCLALFGSVPQVYNPADMIAFANQEGLHHADAAEIYRRFVDHKVERAEQLARERYAKQTQMHFERSCLLNGTITRS
jgi:hypothetical protein